MLSKKAPNGECLPVFLASYSYNVNGLGTHRSDSYELLADKDFESHRVGLTFEVPLGNAAAKSRLRTALYNRRMQLISKERQELLIEREVLDAIDQVETSWQQILASRQSAILEARLYQAEIRQFEVGMRTSTDVLIAQTAYANAQSAEITALVRYEKALVQLAAATGTLLGTSNIAIEPIVPAIGMEQPATGF